MIRLKQIRTLSLLAALSLAGGTSSALAEVVVVVSAKSPVVFMTPNQLADIFLGKTDELPNGAPILPVDRGDNSKDKEEFYRHYMNRSTAQIRAYWAKQIFTGKGEPPKEIADLEQFKKYIAANPSSISYLEREKVDGNLKIVIVEKP